VATPSLTLLVRSVQSDPARLGSAIRAQVRAIDKDQPVGDIGAMDQILADSMAGRRFSMLLLALFAAAALVLAAVGIYGVVSYSVAQRTSEIGIRMALGAQRSDVLRMVFGQGFTLVLAGIGAGLIAAAGSTRLLASLLFGVSPTDWLTFAAVSAILAVVALAASYVPVRRATRVDPLVALRYE
jgi:putative ABC transport system permease protein